MPDKPLLSRDQALNARPIAAQIHERTPLPNGGVRIGILCNTSKIQRWLLRLPEKVTRHFELDTIGLETLEMCTGQTSVRDMIDTFAKKHGIVVAEAEHVILTFLKTLITKGLVAIAVPEKRET